MNKDDYIESLLGEEGTVLRELDRATHLRVPVPDMISGHAQGRLLSMLCRMVRPKRVLEIGTFTGYSTICLAEGLAPGGTIDTIESNDELTEMAADFFAKAGLTERIVQHTGEALEILPKLKFRYDLAFIDGAKKKYFDLYQAVFDKISFGGYILIDNILWHGKIFDEKIFDKTTLVLRNFNTFVSRDERVEVAVLTNRDGLFLIRKREETESYRKPFNFKEES